MKFLVLREINWKNGPLKNFEWMLNKLLKKIIIISWDAPSYFIGFFAFKKNEN